jgi:hypothetical protein
MSAVAPLLGSKGTSTPFWFMSTHLARVGVSIVTALVAMSAATFAYFAYKETKRQARAAWEQVRISGDQEVRQLRAYLIVDPTKDKTLEGFETGWIQARLP